MSSKRAIRRRLARKPLSSKHDLQINRRNACEGKTKYMTWDDADEAMVSLMKSDVFSGGEMNVYQCPIYKSHYHIGHTPIRLLNAKSKEERNRYAYYQATSA